MLDGARGKKKVSHKEGAHDVSRTAQRPVSSGLPEYSGGTLLRTWSGPVTGFVPCHLGSGAHRDGAAFGVCVGVEPAMCVMTRRLMPRPRFGEDPH